MTAKTRRNSMARLGIALLCTIALASCGDDDDDTANNDPGVPGAAAPAPEPITINLQPNSEEFGDEAFGPNPREVLPGTTVTWVNGDTEPHTITSADGLFDSGPLRPGQSFSHSFDQEGSFGYFCSIHQEEFDEQGEIEVNPNAELAGGAGGSPSPSPAGSPTASPLPSPGSSSDPAADPGSAAGDGTEDETGNGTGDGTVPPSDSSEAPGTPGTTVPEPKL